jgi:hypothetical protein
MEHIVPVNPRVHFLQPLFFSHNALDTEHHHRANLQALLAGEGNSAFLIIYGDFGELSAKTDG